MNPTAPRNSNGNAGGPGWRGVTLHSYRYARAERAKIWAKVKSNVTPSFTDTVRTSNRSRQEKHRFFNSLLRRQVQFCGGCPVKAIHLP